MKRSYTSMRTTAFLLMTLAATDASAQQETMTGYAQSTESTCTTKSTAANRGVASRRVHDHHQQLGQVDRRALQNAESNCRRNAGSRPDGQVGVVVADHKFHSS